MGDFRPVIVLDPGHGGTAPAGGSSPNHATGPNGLLEKDLVLDIARRAGTLLAAVASVRLTRSTDVNIPLEARAHLARDNWAAAFLSLHLNASADPGLDGVEAWISRGPNTRNRRLAEALTASLASVTGNANRGVREANLGVLLPSRHSPATATCLLEMGYLSNPGQANRLRTEDYRQRIAAAIADCLRAGLADSIRLTPEERAASPATGAEVVATILEQTRGRVLPYSDAVRQLDDAALAARMRWSQAADEADRRNSSGLVPRLAHDALERLEQDRGLFELKNRLTEYDALRARLTTARQRQLDWIFDLNQSAIAQIENATQRQRFLALNWANAVYPGNRGESGPSLALFSALAALVPERRVPQLLRYFNVERLVRTVSESTQRLFPAAADSFTAMRTRARGTHPSGSQSGFDLVILSGFRSEAEQARIAAGNPNPNAVARNRSAHTYGLAVDLRLSVPSLSVLETRTQPMTNLVAMYRSPVYKWMFLFAADFGWFPFRMEPWHWEYNPPGFENQFRAPSPGGSAQSAADKGLDGNGSSNGRGAGFRERSVTQPQQPRPLCRRRGAEFRRNGNSGAGLGLPGDPSHCTPHQDPEAQSTGSLGGRLAWIPPARNRFGAALSNERVQYQGRPYTPATATFNCAPDPPAVVTAALWPNPSETADDDCRSALGAVGLNVDEVRAFEAAQGLVTLHPFAAVFGGAMLGELLLRLRYNVHQIQNPPHDFPNLAALRSATGLSPAGVLGVRLLLAIPGHFRELARRAPASAEAFALENLGWLLMDSLRGDLNQATGRLFWLPRHPSWVTPFPNPMPSYGRQVQQLILRLAVIDTTLSLGDFRAREFAWSNGLPGRQWSLETGRTPSPLGPGQPFYPAVVSIPAQVNISGQKAQIQTTWNQLVAEIDARLGRLTPAATNELTDCGAHDHRLAPLGLISPVNYGGLELARTWPRLASPTTGLATNGKALTAIKPTAELLFRTIHDLGWHDLLFHTQGSFCLRGIKNGTAQSARNVSDHGFGTAFDLNVFENPQLRRGTTFVPGAMDPRIVKLFESFHFRWGKCFRPADLHHFEYL
jgi:N-acetylmuramoyl-L-alanine amidase